MVFMEGWPTKGAIFLGSRTGVKQWLPGSLTSAWPKQVPSPDPNPYVPPTGGPTWTASTRRMRSTTTSSLASSMLMSASSPYSAS